jgi:hypothetical protein
LRDLEFSRRGGHFSPAPKGMDFPTNVKVMADSSKNLSRRQTSRHHIEDEI